MEFETPASIELSANEENSPYFTYLYVLALALVQSLLSAKHIDTAAICMTEEPNYGGKCAPIGVQQMFVVRSPFEGPSPGNHLRIGMLELAKHGSAAGN